MLVPLLTVEGTGVITPACWRFIQSGDAATLAGLKGLRVSPSPELALLCPRKLAHKVTKGVKAHWGAGGKLWRSRALVAV